MNLYVHFPFCAQKCRYCALHSRAGSDEATRKEYVRQLVGALETTDEKFKTVYFGGGTPTLCDLTPLFQVLAHRLTAESEFTVETHPSCITEDLLARLVQGGVNRLSLGVQSPDNRILAAMNRGHTFEEAERAFEKIHRHFTNAGIDLILGLPGETEATIATLLQLQTWGLQHCSIYSLMVEPHTPLALRLARGEIECPDDNTTLNRLSLLAKHLKTWGLERYEISNFARPGFECRHNLAVWQGEDYRGLGDGASGRIGLTRTTGKLVSGRLVTVCETVSPEADLRERTLFRLRTRAGLSTENFPAWRPILNRFVNEGLLTQAGTTYHLTARGTEVCDTILVELV